MFLVKSSGGPAPPGSNALGGFGLPRGACLFLGFPFGACHFHLARCPNPSGACLFPETLYLDNIFKWRFSKLFTFHESK